MLWLVTSATFCIELRLQDSSPDHWSATLATFRIVLRLEDSSPDALVSQLGHLLIVVNINHTLTSEAVVDGSLS